MPWRTGSIRCWCCGSRCPKCLRTRASRSSASARFPRSTASSVWRRAATPFPFWPSASRVADAAAASLWSQCPRENRDWAWLAYTQAPESARPWLWQISMPWSAAATASSERPIASSEEGRLTLTRPSRFIRCSFSARSRTAYISARPSSTPPASAVSQPRVRRACSSMYSSPTSRAYSTARSLSASASGPGRRSAFQLATLVRTSACTGDGGSPRTSSSAVASSAQPSPLSSACTSRLRCTRNHASRSGSASAARTRMAFLVMARARVRSPPKWAATVASAITSR